MEYNENETMGNSEQSVNEQKELHPAMNMTESTQQNEEDVYAKYSPFADSPYEMHVPVHQPVKVKRTGKRKTGAWKVILSIVLVLVVAAGSALSTAAVLNQRWENKLSAQNKQLEVLEENLEQLKAKLDKAPSQETVIITTPGEETGGKSPAQIYAENVETVVAVSSVVSSDALFGPVGSVGSGFILTENGYIVTNYHVVQDGTEISVTLSNGVEHAAELVGFDEPNDIALLKADAENLPHVTLGSSNALIVGERVAAIGNPLGELTSTLTVGYVSAKDRMVTTDGTTINMLQTDAAINSGNSGGPLFNMKGEVVGITTAKYSGQSNSGATIEGIGFAIPIDDVVGMLEDLKEFGYVKGAYMGVMVKDVTADVSENYGLPLGAFVDEVTAGGAAERAGILAKDIIIALGDQKISSVSELTRALRSFDAGDTTKVTVFRGGSEVELEITFDEKPRG